MPRRGRRHSAALLQHMVVTETGSDFRQRAWHVSSPEEGSGKAGAGPQVIQHCWNIHRAVDVGELGAVRVEGMVDKGRGIFCSAFEVRVLTFFCL